MKTTTLYRPVGLKELELIVAANFTAFPPRLEWQPIFYPVLNKQYAKEIAVQWNLDDEGSGYAGFVTAFDVATHYLEQFEVQNVGGHHHNELWVPAEELERFNANIQGKIKVLNGFYGAKFSTPKNEKLIALLKTL